MFCPVGGGTAAAGYCTTLGAMTDADVVGVQAAGAPAVYRAWQDETLDALDSVDTIAEGVATRVPFALPTEILQAGLADFRLVSEDAITDAVARLFERTASSWTGPVRRLSPQRFRLGTNYGARRSSFPFGTEHRPREV